MGMSYIYNEVEHLVKKYKSRNPFDILSAMNVVVKESGAYQKLKGYCFSANRHGICCNQRNPASGRKANCSCT